MDITAKSRQRQLKSSTALPLQSTAPFNKSTSAIHLHQTADTSPTKPLWEPSHPYIPSTFHYTSMSTVLNCGHHHQALTETAEIA